MIRSYDVFDTLITRGVYEPRDIFLLLGHDLVKNGIVDSKEKFFEIRVAAERSARLTSSYAEITLDEIYAELCRLTGWPETILAECKQREQELEKLFARPIAKNLDELASVRGDATTALVSDIYLEQKTVAQILAPFLGTSKTELFVSSEHRATKHAGDLYDQVVRALNGNYENWHHVGDNKAADVDSAAKRGIQPRLYTGSKPTRYEQWIANYHPRFKMELSLYAGAMKAARLSKHFNDAHQQTLWEVSTNVIGPVLFNYVYWILHHARQQGIERLYFVSRDGQILQRIAHAIVANGESKEYPECRYLYGSRQAWHIPAITDIGERELDWLFDSTELLTVESVCARANLNPTTIEPALSQAGFRPEIWRHNLDKGGRDRLRFLFSNDNTIKKTIIANAAQYRELARAYLRQEGLFDGRRVAMVDIGWSGRLQSSLSKVLDICGVRPANGVHGYYFGLRKRSQIFSNDEMFCFFKDPDNHAITDRLCDYPALYEIFVAADHGSVIAYAKSDIDYTPVLREQRNHALLDWGLLVQQEGIMAFVTEYFRNSNSGCEGGTELPHKALTAGLLQRFFVEPTPREALCYGRVRIYEDQTENIAYELAPRLKFTEVLASIVSHQRKIHQNLWLEAAIARQDKAFATLLKAAHQFKRTLAAARS